ncbi:MAG: 30S ribosomal protein S13 [Euryarchaeota archaeon]|jgi:small subunit ribosomal protein S13|nr:30S ribosomal protein S13 [Euryarchaeota archaeon]MCH2641521.1 30S ribosomal protein S13 [Candidatus Thalassarchaeum sp.]MED6296861.1 30S ribosomal protein S13 [Candidatus Thermoplasmatota archaeon]GIS44323.1 MAG: 30S ribosomal protein S13 [Candidatus Poseidoniales archaeon]MBE57461.1 30S ribosomal protein S13 [Euryarchaeota archaeon]|tara:strand:+ start:482 stop:949 length:468 start_codon:yes stop_codon:yes gene_type:complete
MAKIDESELGDDFNYIIRLADSDIDGLSRIGMGLTSVKGVGARTAMAICEIAGVDKEKLGGHLNDEELQQIRDAIESYPTEVPLWMLNRQRDIETGDELHLFSMDVSMTQDDDIARLRATKAYRGLRHAARKRVRGQRTRSNGRSGLTLGVQRKK